MNFKKLSVLILTAVSLFIAGCKSNTDKENTLKVGTISGPETELMLVAKKVAKDKYGLDVEIVEFSDYATPNTALNDGSIDANVIQHLPYLQENIRMKHYALIPIGKTFIYPMGIYSEKIKKLSDLPDHAIVAIPNDPSNEMRALLLLEKAGLIRLKSETDRMLTKDDIIENPKKLVFKPLNAAQLPRALPDVTLAAINTNYAVLAGLLPTKDALFAEGKDSLYANIIVVRTKDATNPKALILVKSLNSDEVKAAGEKLFHGNAIPAWD